MPNRCRSRSICCSSSRTGLLSGPVGIKAAYPFSDFGFRHFRTCSGLPSSPRLLACGNHRVQPVSFRKARLPISPDRPSLPVTVYK
jgi:hypothetical protein